MNKRNFRLALSLAAIMAALPMTSKAQETALRVIVPYSAGGSADVIARMLTDGLKEHMGRMAIVENRPGAGGRIALSSLKAAPGDGAAVVLAFTGVLVNSIVFQNAKDFSFKDDFVGLAQVGTMPAGLAVPWQHKANNLKEFIDLRKQEGDFVYGNMGPGSLTHLAGLRFAAATHLKANPIAYQGGAPMANDLMGGQIDSGLDTVGDFVERHKGKKLKVLGVMGSKRFSLLPDVPTMAEQGVANVEAEMWLGFLGSSKNSPAFNARFQEAVKKTMESPALREKMGKLIDIEYKASADFRKVMEADFATWTPLIVSSGLVQN
ncbi:Bug family tripartite tricarboxylate transporter substrate binding protein [Diaphorobacter caeni]|uniref:Bug family tripartite tricarboxylate transporter substrate binding protein n=1 Tax=Diaphorobacter caeni TaxID=2784387 RepID=UPI00188F0414|nr:tripartite tricarboxylate transporter substrate binding protein [Diaphorobacter caeni]MBF5005739.1 tripartite tricarboxylate transporter substrate binding protein [Diaphorobacter caeni]